jgi:hypothetical protein
MRGPTRLMRSYHDRCRLDDDENRAALLLDQAEMEHMARKRLAVAFYGVPIFRRGVRSTRWAASAISQPPPRAR